MAFCVVLMLLAGAEPGAQPPLQAALDAQPGHIVHVPPGEHFIDDALTIRHAGSGLAGPGRIVQANAGASIIRVQADDVTVEGLTLVRAAGAETSTQHAIEAVDCKGLTLRNLTVRDNRSNAGTVYLRGCRDSRVEGCRIVNYKRIAVDDRTASPLYGYAFRVIDGTGILAADCKGLTVQNNHVIEDHLYPTPETQAAHGLGQLTEGAHPTKKGRLAPPGDYASNWHQGSAIVVTGPLETDHVLVTGNYIRNAAQGIDLHADRVVCSHNVIDHAFIGIKCMHGSRHVIISHNNLSHNDLWGIVMMPGTASHPAEAATAGRPPRPANYTSGNLIAHNVFSDFGYGYDYHVWQGNGAVIMLDSGQLPENPVMFDVLIQGNIVYNTGADGLLEEGQPVDHAPRYRYAVQIATEPRPEGLRFSGNLFHPGRDGVSNMDLARYTTPPTP